MDRRWRRGARGGGGRRGGGRGWRGWSGRRGGGGAVPERVDTKTAFDELVCAAEESGDNGLVVLDEDLKEQILDGIKDGQWCRQFAGRDGNCVENRRVSTGAVLG